MFAGAFVALGAAFFTVVMGDAQMGFAAQRALGGLCFCLGLELVLLCGAELFTGNALMVLGKASGKISGQGLVSQLVHRVAGQLCGRPYAGGAHLHVEPAGHERRRRG